AGDAGRRDPGHRARPGDLRRLDLHAVPGRAPVPARALLAPARRRHPPGPRPGQEGVKPFRVVVAGRPNVGKSALFNRLVRRRRSLVHDLPGVTRDVLEAEAALPDGRTFRLLDTGGFDPEGRERIPRAVRDKAVEAIRSADLVLLVTDASAGVLPGDEATARIVRESGR